MPRRRWFFARVSLLSLWGCFGSSGGGVVGDGGAGLDGGGTLASDASGGVDAGSAFDAAGSMDASNDADLLAPVAPLVISTRKLANQIAGTSSAQTLVANQHGVTWNATTIAPGMGSNGITLHSSTGVLDGAPEITGLQPLYVVAQSATDSVGVQMELPISGTGSSDSIISALTQGQQDAPYQSKLTTTWTDGLGCGTGLQLAFGSLPPGLSANGLNGDITGTPTVAGSFASTWYAEWSTCGSTKTNYTTLVFDIASNPSSALPPGVSGFRRSALTPVLQASSTGFDDRFLGAPSVVRVGSQYFLYYEAQHEADSRYAVGLATSSDGVSFTRAGSTPVLAPSASGWDSQEVRFPTVSYDGASFRMWYWGSRDGRNMSIGLATSSDGRHWSKSKTAVHIASADAPLFGYGPGTVLASAQGFTLFYSSGGSIGRADSTDGLDFQDRGMVLIPDSADVRVRYGRPGALLDSGKYLLWYTIAEEIGTGAAAQIGLYPVRIGAASSTDGTSFTVHGTDVSPGAAGAWDRPCVGMPSVLKVGSTFHMWYAGGRASFPGAILDAHFFVEGALGHISTGP